MKNLMYIALTGCIFLLFVSVTYAQKSDGSSEFVYRNWNNQNGLPQNTVYDLLEDSIGYLWGATEEGLFRFDGSRFHVINDENTPGLLSNNFYALRSQGPVVWAASRNSVLRIRNHVEKLFDFSMKLNGGWIKCLEVDKEGDVWIGASSGLLYRIKADSAELISTQGSHSPISSIDVLKSSARGMLLGSPQGLFYLAPGSREFKSVTPLKDIAINTIAEGRQSDWWVGTATKGVVRVINDTVLAGSLAGLQENFVNHIHYDNSDRLWIGFRSSGYQLFEDGVLYRPKQDDYEHDGIRSILVTRSNMVWLGTTSSGLLQLRKALINRLPDSLPLRGPITLGIYQDQDSDIWVGTAGRGLNHISGGRVQHYNQLNGLSSNLVISTGGRGEFVYIGTSDGLDRYNKKLKRFDRHFTTADGLRANGVIAICNDSKSRLWICTRTGGLQYIGPDEKVVPFQLPAAVSNVNLLTIMEDRRGNIWLGSRGAGMLRVLPDNKVEQFDASKGFPADIVYAFWEDEEGDIWMSSEKGLVLYHNNTFHLFGKESGLHFNETYRLLLDKEKYIWMSGNLGLQRVSWLELKRAKDAGGKPVKLAVRLFNEFDGMPNSESNGGFYPAGWQMKDQTIWFPTIGGVALVDPDMVTRDEKRMDIHVQSLQFADRQFFPGQQIRLPSGVYNFEIRYTSINFSNASDIQYSYRLKGLDDNWTDAGNRQIAYFSALPPGHYTFEVKAELYGESSPIGELSFYIMPHFFQTIWFKVLLLLMILLAAAGVVLYFRYNAQRRIRQQQLITRAQMEGQEKERQLISAELHDSINQQLSTAKIYLDYAKANEADREELIGKSAEVIHRAIQEIRSLCYSITPVGLKDMGLREAVEDLCRSYASVGKFRTTFNYQISQAQLPEDLQFVLFRVVQEQMNNIARHADASHVQIDLEDTPSMIIARISDDGQGFDKKTAREGLGFANMRNRVSVYKGKIEVESSPGHGCHVTVRIPRK